MGTGGVFLRKLRAKVANEPTGFVWVERGKLAGSGYPASRAQIEWLTRAGVRSILTLTEKPLPSDWLDGLDLMTGHVPMKDHMAPSVDSLRQAVVFIERMVADGRPVLVHCLAGEGRTGCVLAAYLIESRGIGAPEALGLLRKAKPEFVESAQERAVYEYEPAQGRDRV